MKTLPTDMDLLKGFETNWAKQKFASPTQKTLVAVSGGIDSMALAHLFLKAGLPFGIAHCNFQLRGDESDKDEVLVREWAFANNIPFHHTRFETKQKMDEWKKGVQETARMLRYEWFAEVCEEYKYSYIATAHHANDNAETLMMHLFKGTGMAGLHGIPVKNDRVIRPLLFASRKEIETYVAANDIKYREDASNATDNYLRNEVRHHILPVIEKVFPEGIRHLRDSIERFAEAETIYRKAIDAEIKRLVEQRGKDIYIPVLKLQKAEALQTICYELFTPYGFTPAQLPSIISLLTAESGHWVGSATHKVIRNRLFPILYLSGIVASSLPSYIRHKDNSYYRSLGASGGVAAIIFSAIYFSPWTRIYIIVLPLPAILFAVGYLLYSAYMDKHGSDNIGHNAHFWGAVYGFVFTLLFDPTHGRIFFEQLMHPSF